MRFDDIFMSIEYIMMEKYYFCTDRIILKSF